MMQSIEVEELVKNRAANRMVLYLSLLFSQFCFVELDRDEGQDQNQSYEGNWVAEIHGDGGPSV